jgi:hypothetical protein
MTDKRHYSDTQSEFVMLERRERLLLKVEGFWVFYEAMTPLSDTWRARGGSNEYEADNGLVLKS